MNDRQFEQLMHKLDDISQHQQAMRAHNEQALLLHREAHDSAKSSIAKSRHVLKGLQAVVWALVLLIVIVIAYVALNLFGEVRYLFHGS